MINWNEKMTLTWSYSKVNRRINGTLHTIPKHHHLSVDGGNWLTAGSGCWPGFK